jgi:hypothetical protein
MGQAVPTYLEGSWMIAGLRAVLCCAVVCCAVQGYNLSRVVLVDNDDYKAADGEHENMLHVPHWEQTQGECCRCCVGAGISCGNSAQYFGREMEQYDPVVVCSSERSPANALSGNARGHRAPFCAWLQTHL